jgi:MFS family permease
MLTRHFVTPATSVTPATCVRKGARRAPWLRVAPALAVASWGGNQFTPLLDLYRRDAGFTQVQVDVFLACYIVGLVPMFLLSGPLSDRVGRRPLMLAAAATGALASLVLAVGAHSPALLCAGRLIAGLSVATAMTVGTNWIRELSAAPHDGGAAVGGGARRASLTLTVGLGAGAGTAGVLAQWGPHPTVVPYAVHVAMTLAAAPLLLTAPETSPLDRARPLRAGLGIPPHARARFLRVVAPLAPWVFAASALAYVIAPTLLGPQAGGDQIALATLLTIVALATGTLAQQQARRLSRLTGGRDAIAGLALILAGALACALNASARSVPLALAIAVVLGAGYGIAMVAGLTEVQNLIRPDRPGSLSGLYYSLCYLGFALPAALAALASRVSYPVLLAGVAATAAVSLAVVSRRTSRSTPSI